MSLDDKMFNGKDKEKDLYEVLGVNRSDSCADIKKAYLRLARTHHPDKGGDPERFKEIARASEILTDELKRRQYDERGLTESDNAFSFPFDINDLFGMFGNRGSNINGIRKGKKDAPVIQTIPLSLDHFYVGHQFDVHINRQGFCKGCDHTGASMKEVCMRCGGQGCISQYIQVGPMTMNTVGPCLDCQGKGERVVETCKLCSGTGMVPEKKTLTIKVPPGKLSNETMVFPEVCSDHPGFEKPADVHIVISEDSKDPGFITFKRSGKNLECSVTISLFESLLGTVIELHHHPGYEDGLFIQLPPGSFTSDRYCLVGAGMPIMGQLGLYGDLFITITVHITEEDRKQYFQFVPLLDREMNKDKEKEKEKEKEKHKSKAFPVTLV